MYRNYRKGLVISKENEGHFEKTNKCHTCNRLYPEEDIKVRDHCHIAGEYRGSGNLNLWCLVCNDKKDTYHIS